MGGGKILRAVYIADTTPIETVMEVGRKGYQTKKAKIEEAYIAISGEGEERHPLRVRIDVKCGDYGEASVGYSDMNKLEKLMRDIGVETSNQLKDREVLLYEIDEFPVRILGLSATEEIH